MSRIELDTKNIDDTRREYPYKGKTGYFWIHLASGGDKHLDKTKLAQTAMPRTYEIDYARIYVKIPNRQ